MAVRTNAFVICLCTCFMLGHRIDALISMNQTCALYNGYIADPANCKSWAFCQGGVVAARGTCPDGFLYDSRSGQCNYADKTECIISKTDMCKGENAVLKADPNDCSNYCYCNNGVTETGRCPNNQHYNPSTQRCVWASTFTECIADSPCHYVPNNKFTGVPNPKSCRAYNRCVDHVGYLGYCAEGYVFNPSNGKCDTFTTMQCPDKPIETNPGETPPNIAEVCKDYDTVKKGNQPFADGVSCPGYVICTAVGKGVWQRCPWATHFDPMNKTCATPYQVGCNWNRCEGINRSFMTVAGTECKKFVTCDGQLSSKQQQSCADVDPKYPYFAENVGGCVKEKPANQKICDPVA